MVRPLSLAPARRRRALAALAVGVAAIHGCVTQQLAERIGTGARPAAMPARFQVRYVHELEPVAAPQAMRPVEAVPPRRPARALAAATRASAPAPAPEATATPGAEAVAAAEPEPVPAPGAEPASAPAPAPASAPEAAVAAASPGPAAAASAPAAAASAAAGAGDGFDWPRATRLSYRLTGQYRGEIHGEAQVEWIREGGRYQVHLDVTVGLPFAPLLSRRMSSTGELTLQGLVPQRYDEDTKLAFRDRRRVTLQFEPQTVQLAHGGRRARPPGTQDAASQFVQLAFLFGSDPARLREGGVVELPLALPRSLDVWAYEVVGQETLYTVFGEVPAFHLRPRRMTRPGGELVAEAWFAPGLRYLPVRIRIHQDAETFIDLLLARKPEVAGP